MTMIRVMTVRAGALKTTSRANFRGTAGMYRDAAQVASLRRAAELGASTATTDNDESNAPMLAVTRNGAAVRPSPQWERSGERIGVSATTSR
jgi:hypothetical protein